MKKALPIGVDNFEKIRKENYYYVDKTALIKEMLDLKGEVNLFTRPRRFGKTLNLSMLRYFFEDTGNTGKNDCNKELFRGLDIMDAGEPYTSQMGKYPVINLTLKSAKQEDFETAYYMIQTAIAAEFARHRDMVERGRICFHLRNMSGIWILQRNGPKKKSSETPYACSAAACMRLQENTPLF